MTFRQRLTALWLLVWLTALPAVTARAGPTLLFEAPSGRILYAEEMDDQWHPASLTKIMTAYVTFQAIKAGRITLETPITYSESASAQPPSKIGLLVGSTITVDLALQSLIVKSANDIAVALAEAVGGSEAQFVEQMNAVAKAIGMTRTRFMNPHGLPAGQQVTTARDLARLAMAVTRDFPQYSHYWSQSQVQIGNVRIISHNGLFKTLEGADGMKTGFICDSGYNIVASATRDGVRLMAVVLGESTALERNARAQQLLEHGYATLGWKLLLGGGPDTVGSMALAPDAKDAASIRNSVIAIECQNRRIARAAQVARKRAKARSKAEAARKAGEKTPPAVVQKTTAPPAPGGPAPKSSAATKAIVPAAPAVPR